MMVDSLDHTVQTNVWLFQRFLDGVYATEDAATGGQVLKNEWVMRCMCDN